MNTEITKTNKASYNTLRELINSSMEGLKIILTHDNDGQPKVQVEYLGDNSKEKAERVSSAFRELSKEVKPVAPKLPPVNVATQQQPITKQNACIYFHFPDFIMKELRYLSENAMWKPDDENALSIRQIASRLLINYFNEFKDTPINDIVPYRSEMGTKTVCCRLPESMIRFIKNTATENKVSIDSVGVMLFHRALKQTGVVPIPPVRPSVPRGLSYKYPCLLDIKGPDKFMKRLRDAAHLSSQSVSQYVCDAVSELAKNGESILRPKQGSRRLMGKRKHRCVRVLEQTREDAIRLSKTYKMSIESIVYEAVISQLEKTGKATKQNYMVKRIPSRKSKYLGVKVAVSNAVYNTLVRSVPKGMRFSRYVSNIIIEELQHINGEELVAERFSFKKRGENNKNFPISIPQSCRGLFDNALMGYKASSPAALCRELLTRWVMRQSQR